jgi:putative MATE family efflux protein
MRVKRNGMDMTAGNIPRLLLAFSFPLMLGNLFQEAYNAFDAVIVGNYVGSGALAAVGMSMPVNSVVIGFFMGLSNGAAILVARYFGAKEDALLHKAVHTTMFLAVVTGVALSVIGVLITPWMLHAIRIPEEIFEDTAAYFSICFSGMAALTIYNMGTAILNALGESKKPLVFLLISAIINIILDIVFVAGFHWGVKGAAYSTVIAEIVSAVLVLATLSRPGRPCRLKLRLMRPDMPILAEAMGIGLPIASQSVLIGGSNLLMQGYINGLGISAIAGWGITAKINAFIYMMSQAVALGVTTFVGQNLGAGQVKRARKGVVTALVIALSITIVNAVILLLFNYRLLRVFSDDPKVLECAFTLMKVLTSTYCIFSILQVLQNALAAGGKAVPPMLTNLFSHVAVRQAYLFAVSKLHYTLVAVAVSYPLAWVLSGGILMLLYFRSDWNGFAFLRKSVP